MKYNMIHLYIGDGKGKTSASYGLALRALGSGLKVLIISFLKNSDSGEIAMIKKLSENFGEPEIHLCPNKHGFYFAVGEEEKAEIKKDVENLFKFFEEALLSDKFDMIISDEMIDAVNLGLIDEDRLISLLSLRKAEVVLTGRNPSDKLTGIADYISYVKKVKHPFDNGITARRGIEF